MITKDNTANKRFSEENTHLIRIKDYYPDDCSEQEFMEVSDEVLFQLETYKKGERNYHKWVKRHRAGSLHIDDEDFLGYMGKYIESNTDESEIDLFLDQALSICGEIVLRRMKLLVAGYTKTEIAEIEAVCYTSISASIEKAKKVLAELLIQG